MIVLNATDFKMVRDCPGGLVVETLCFQCRVRGFDPRELRSHMLCGMAKR